MKFIFLLLWMILLPLVGAYLVDPNSITYRFSPSAILVTSKDQIPPHSISWSFTFFLALFGAFLAAGFSALLQRGRNRQKEKLVPEKEIYSFPSWGWIAAGSLLICWSVAWWRLDSLKGLNHLAFSSIWFSYIALINALSYRRKGECILLNQPALLLRLFAASIPFWWYFEYLNRFVFNWYYLFNHSSGAFQYIVFGTLAFGTVLPAVISTYEFLRTFPALKLGFDHLPKLSFQNPRIYFSLLFIVSSLILFLLPVFPNQLFLFLWIAPLFLLVGLQGVSGEKQVFSPTAQGNYSTIATAALAALIAGSLWELWNFYSVPKWIYSVPYVNHLKLFEMPLIGYLGYLPFGMECLAIYRLLYPLKND